MSDASRELSDLSRAGANVIQVVSYEWERVRGEVIAPGRDLRMSTWSWNYSQGLLQLHVDETTPESADRQGDPMQLLEAPEGWLGKSGGILLLEDIHPYLEPGEHQFIRWVRQWKSSPPRATHRRSAES